MRKLLYITAIAALAAGCNSNSTDPGGSAGHPLISAKPGSTWTLDITQKDSAGSDVTTPITQFDSIVATGLTYEGKSNVVKVYQRMSNGQEGYGYYALESNGDLSFYLNAGNQPGVKTQWLVLPFGGSGNVTTVISDLTQTAGGYYVTQNETAVFSPTSPISMTVQGQSISAMGVRGVFTISTTSDVPGYPNSQTVLPDNYYYWSTDVGFVAKSVLVQSTQFYGKVTTTQTLRSFTIQ